MRKWGKNRVEEKVGSGESRNCERVESGDSRKWRHEKVETVESRESRK